MNKSDSLKLIYWGTAGCASRAVSNFLTGIYVKDLMFYHDERGWVNIFKGEGSHTHQQGIPKGTDDSYKIICNTRNPYTMCFSSWTDINEETGEYEKSNGETVVPTDSETDALDEVRPLVRMA